MKSLANKKEELKKSYSKNKLKNDLNWYRWNNFRVEDLQFENQLDKSSDFSLLKNLELIFS